METNEACTEFMPLLRATHTGKVVAHWMRSGTEMKDSPPPGCAWPGACAMTRKEMQPTKCVATCGVHARQLQCQHEELAKAHYGA